MSKNTISIMESALDILQDMKEGKDPTINTVTHQQTQPREIPVPDIKKVQVPDDFVLFITEGKIPDKPKENIITLTKDQVKERLDSLIAETKKLVAEMTTCGMIGTGPGKKKKIKLKKIK